MFDSVRSRLTLWYTGVLALVLAAFAVASYLFLSRALERRTDESLAEMSRAFSETLRTEQEELRQAGATNARGVTPDADAAVTEAAAEYRLKDYQFIVYDKRRVVATSPGQAAGPELIGPPPSSPGILNLLDDLDSRASESPAYSTLSHGGERFRALALNVTTDGRPYALVIIRPLSEQEELLKGAVRALLVGVPLALLLASIGGYFLARKSLAPVVAMSETAARIGAANLQERLPVVNERDELGQLARAFNQLLARLDESFEQQRRFMADASHELRTPVSIVRGESEVALSREGRAADDLRESLSIVHDEGRRLTRIVEDLFMLARADAGQRPLKLCDFYLDETAAECVRAVRSLAAKRGLALECEAASELPFRGDEELVRRMLLNLLDNAIKYTPAGGRVFVKSEARGGEYVLTVTDTGVGIPPEMQSHVFERFYRVDKARSRAGGDDGAVAGSGAGLGLAIARFVAEAHGGRLELLRSDERGSIFVASLPAPDAGAA
jgi:two-component system OmpR family sensor kinase